MFVSTQIVEIASDNWRWQIELVDTEFTTMFVVEHRGDGNKGFREMLKQIASIYEKHNQKVALNIILYIQSTPFWKHRKILIELVDQVLPQYKEELEKYLLLV